MSKSSFKNLSPKERREFLTLAGAMLASPFVPKQTAQKCLDLLLPRSYAQQKSQGTFFLEVNFRDQWDFAHAIMAPSLARNADNYKSRHDLAYFDRQADLIQGPNNFWLTKQGAPLRPHLNDIAVMELGEVCIGNTHAHEAGNGLRSPGRSKNRRSGTKDMATIDKRPRNRAAGNEVLYSSSPTPAILHNYYSKQQGAKRNGVILRSSIRENTHTFYHYEGNLNNAQLDRYYNKNTLLQAFPNTNNNTNQNLSLLQRHGEKLADLLKYVDSQFFTRKPSMSSSKNTHEALLNEWGQRVQGNTSSNTNINLTQQEINFWTNNIPMQKSCPGDRANACRDVGGKTNLGELYAYVSKLFISNTVKTAAIDFDFHDVHGTRNRLVLETQGKSTAEPLARFIQTMKNAGLWNRTVVAIYTLDGSRGPNKNSTGYGTKNALILAGGGIKGGYYGDIDYNNGWVWKRPDNNGNPVAGTKSETAGRVANADVYKTVAKAAGISDSLVNSFSDVRNGRLLNYMLK